MIALWALCVMLGPIDDTSAPLPPEPVSHIIPESLTSLLTLRPELAIHHEGYLKELARRPDLAESETAWWQISSGPALRNVAARFEDALARDNTAQYRFNVYFDSLNRSRPLREAVENLVRTEMDQVRDDPALAAALPFLRANPDIALRFLENPLQVRPLPAPLQDAYESFTRAPEWSHALHRAYDRIAQLPEGHLAVFPWWREQAALENASGGEPLDLDGRLYERSDHYWLWHLRNMNLANHQEMAPWIRYWNRLIQQDPDLARDYGPFVTRLIQNPELLRQHLADLEANGHDSEGTWPPPTTPPGLPPLTIRDPVEELRNKVVRPAIDQPAQPDVEKPSRPQRPQSPASPTRPTIAPIETSPGTARR